MPACSHFRAVRETFSHSRCFTRNVLSIPLIDLHAHLAFFKWCRSLVPHATATLCCVAQLECFNKKPFELVDSKGLGKHKSTCVLCFLTLPNIALKIWAIAHIAGVRLHTPFNLFAVGPHVHLRFSSFVCVSDLFIRDEENFVNCFFRMWQ